MNLWKNQPGPVLVVGAPLLLAIAPGRAAR
jgi:hypothetical protein